MSDARDIRIQKANKLREAGHQPYPDRFLVSHTINDLKKLENDSEVALAGRVLTLRRFGKLIFVTIGNANFRCQISLKKPEVGDESFKLFVDTIDLGDHIGLNGSKYITKTNEPTLAVSKWVMLSKTLLPLPDKHHGLTDEKTSLKQRYLLTSTNQIVADVYIKRAQLRKSLRNYLDNHGFMEVDTPAIQIQKSGALAKSFSTHHNALDIEAELRIAPETYLKRALVGGFERVYEIAVCFRNEGMSPAHWPEFHMLEFYAAYWNFEDLINFTERMFKKVVQEVVGNTLISYQGKSIDFSGEWSRVSFRQLLIDTINLDINKYSTTISLRDEILKRNLLEETMIISLGRGNLIDALYKKHARPNIVDPIFLIEHPKDVSPLARSNDKDETIVDRFQLVVNGWELVNAYSELADPIEQRKRFEEQAKAVAEGDEDALDIDEDFLLALEHGMPPAAGWGMGLERVLALLTNCSNIKDTIMFPIHR